MDLQLDGKVALVTGGSSGLGKAICLAFAAEGVKVGVNYLRNEKIDLVDDANAVVEAIRSAGGEAIAIPGDLASEDDIVAMFDALTEAFGVVDILVNNAAYLPTGPMTECTREEWDYTFTVNASGVFVASRELARRLLAAERPGKIVNIASQAAFRGSTTGHLAYDSSKGAMISMTRALTLELSAKGININAIAPGMIKTEMVARTWEKNKERYLARIPIKRIALPEEVANVAVFLASAGASYMSGATVDVSGGMAMH